MKKVLGVITFSFGTLLFGHVVYVWGIHPELTYMQIFMQQWHQWVSGGVLIGMSSLFFN